MKKLTLLTAALLVMALVLAGCSGTTVGAFASKYYNSEDYSAGVQEVQNYISTMEGCKVTRIDYAGDGAVKAEADDRRLSPERIIILTSTIETGSKDPGDGLAPDKTYEGYQWVLTRNSSAELWEIAEHGTP